MKKTIEFKVGMIVKIPMDLKYTTEVYTTTSEMKRLIGSMQKINSVYTGGDLSISGWSWDRRDFKPPTPPKKIPIVHFDPEELVI